MPPRDGRQIGCRRIPERRGKIMVRALINQQRVGTISATSNCTENCRFPFAFFPLVSRSGQALTAKAVRNDRGLIFECGLAERLTAFYSLSSVRGLVRALSSFSLILTLPDFCMASRTVPR